MEDHNLPTENRDAGILQGNIQDREELKLPERTTPLRLLYMFRERLCTVIDVDDKNRCVEVTNYTDCMLKRAFGRVERHVSNRIHV